MRTALASEDLFYSRMDTPIGGLLLVGRRGQLTGLFVTDHDHSPQLRSHWKEDDDALDDARRQLGEYFDGRRRAFDLDLFLDGTPFEVAVWTALREIFYGETTSYGELARRIGRPGASRAVGAANGRNPISIIVPCHRVIGADGTLTGYGWGTARKAWLLNHEGRRRSRRG
jgi:methylated-DNA-[protein]-cysteine S-methyltransferase